MQGPLKCGWRRQAACAALTLLLAAPAAFADPQDAAYVDGPAGRLVDPARADGGTISSAGPPSAHASGAPTVDPAALTQMQVQMMQKAVADARQAEQEAALAGMPPAQPGTGPTPMQQIGTGLVQDAAGLIDAGIQRQTGVMVVNPYPQALPPPGASDPTAPSAPSGW